MKNPHGEWESFPLWPPCATDTTQMESGHGELVPLLLPQQEKKLLTQEQPIMMFHIHPFKSLSHDGQTHNIQATSGKESGTNSAVTDHVWYHPQHEGPSVPPREVCGH